MFLIVSFFSSLFLSNPSSLIGLSSSPYRIINGSDLKKSAAAESFRIRDVAVLSMDRTAILNGSNREIYMVDGKGSFTEKLPLKFANQSNSDRLRFIYHKSKFYVLDSIKRLLSVFDEKGGLLYSIPLSEKLIPRGIALVELEGLKHILISGYHSERSTNEIVSIDQENHTTKNFMVDINIISREPSTMPLWSSSTPFANDRYLYLGFHYENTILKVDKTNKAYKAVSMDPYYQLYEEWRGDIAFPAGYSATAFSAGPNNSILVAGCDNEARLCNRVWQFDSELTTVMAKWSPSFHIWLMGYVPDKHLFFFVTGKQDVIFHQTQSNQEAL